MTTRDRHEAQLRMIADKWLAKETDRFQQFAREQVEEVIQEQLHEYDLNLIRAMLKEA